MYGYFVHHNIMWYISFYAYRYLSGMPRRVPAATPSKPLRAGSWQHATQPTIPTVLQIQRVTLLSKDMKVQDGWNIYSYMFLHLEKHTWYAWFASWTSTFSYITLFKATGHFSEFPLNINRCPSTGYPMLSKSTPIDVHRCTPSVCNSWEETQVVSVDITLLIVPAIIDQDM